MFPGSEGLVSRFQGKFYNTIEYVGGEVVRSGWNGTIWLRWL